MSSVDEALEELQGITGFVAAGVAHSDSGMSMGSITTGDFDIDVALATNTEVVQAKLRAIARFRKTPRSSPTSLWTRISQTWRWPGTRSRKLPAASNCRSILRAAMLGTRSAPLPGHLAYETTDGLHTPVSGRHR